MNDISWLIWGRLYTVNNSRHCWERTGVSRNVKIEITQTINKGNGVDPEEAWAVWWADTGVPGSACGGSWACAAPPPRGRGPEFLATTGRGQGNGVCVMDHRTFCPPSSSEMAPSGFENASYQV